MFLHKDPRVVSIDILTNVLLRNKKLKDEFNAQIEKIDTRDIAFVKNLVYGVLRIKESLDLAIKKYYRKSYDQLTEKHKNIFRIGVYQIDRMNSVPDYASVNTTVEIAKKESLSFSKVVNAILMNFIRNNDKINTNILNHSMSLISHWEKDYTKSQILDLCNWNNVIPVVWFRVNRESLKKLNSIENILFKKHPDIDNFISFKDTKYAIDNFVKTGLIEVQSPSSGLVSQMLDLSKEDVIIDACASPGGKTRHILEIMSNSNILHINDKGYDKYLKLIKDFEGNLESVSCKDASKDSFPMADKILLDVPCSSTGTIQKNPDIKWKRHNLRELNLLQLKVLKNMSKFLNKNGAIIYSTCSLCKSENFKIIDSFLKNNKDFKLDDASKFIDSKYVNNGCLSIFPPKFNLEGMFAARLIRV